MPSGSFLCSVCFNRDSFFKLRPFLHQGIRCPWFFPSLSLFFTLHLFFQSIDQIALVAMSGDSNKLALLERKGRKQLPNVQHLANCEIFSYCFGKGNSSSWSDRQDTKVTLQSESEVARYELIKQTFNVWICSHQAVDRNGYPLYVELAFASADTAFVAKRFFETFIRPDGTLVNALLHVGGKKPKSMYIPADFAHPKGHFFHQLLSCRPERVKALLIAAYGLRNPILCSCCIRSFLSTASWNKEHILYPFHTCISLGSFQDGKCANCVWHMKQCEWSSLGGYKATGPREGPLDWPLLGKDSLEEQSDSWGVDQMNQITCPRVTCQFPSGSAKEDARVIEDAAKVIQRIGKRRYSL